MLKIKGKINTAICYASVIEEEAIEQIRRMCDYEFTEGSRIRIMPDVHAGKGCTIGTTMTVVDKAVPNIVGVDIGCGMYTVNIGKAAVDFEKMDEAAHYIPSGMNVWEGRQERFDLQELRCYRSLKDAKRLERSLGTLGGGNHFIEIDEAADGTKYCWYYRTVAEYLELELNRTGAFKELIKHINYLWPGTFDSDKARYRKYKEISLAGCRLIGSGQKGEVYRYDDELILKVYNRSNTYRDVEREIAMSRRAFVLGIPTAISFGIVSVGDRYGAMYELVDSETISACIARNPSGLESYAAVMAELARTIHSTQSEGNDDFPDTRDRFRSYITNGIGRSDRELADRCMQLIDKMPDTKHLIHGDFHTSNVFLQNSETC